MAWFDAAWAGRFPITSQNAQVDEANDNVVYDLNLAPAGFWSGVNATDGRDIRVTTSDGTTECAFEVSGFVQASSIGSLYFVATGLSISVDTTYYVYYGNPAATMPAAGAANGKQAVWASYSFVAHLDEAATPAVDSKAAVSGAGNGGVTFGGTGKLRLGPTFDGATGRIDFGDVVDITTASLTLSAWINPTSLGEVSGGRIIQKATTATDFNGYRFNLNSSTGLAFAIGDAAAVTTVNSTNTVITLSALQYVAVTYDGANARFYVNAVAKGAPALTRVPTNGTAVLVLGNDSGGTIRSFDGIIDDARISTAIRSANYLTTEYNNQNSPSTFWATGAAESQAVAIALSLGAALLAGLGASTGLGIGLPDEP